MADPVPPPQLQLQIVLDDEQAQGMYCNLALLSHNEAEFTLDFVYVQPQQPKAKVRARVITSPLHAKRLMLALQENVARFEARFGEIKLPATPEIVPRH